MKKKKSKSSKPYQTKDLLGKKGGKQRIATVPVEDSATLMYNRSDAFPRRKPEQEDIDIDE